ncbi:MAG TPA: hypothetical protein VFB72_12755 [Verrucomicrobiae bacterium]|nr:hypothetical protein [Verrucomicrobiae bacterium]
MKTAILLAVLAMTVAGCSTSNEPAGAPPNNYDTDIGQGRGAIVQTNGAPTYPEGSYYLWKNRGITPTTP